MGPHALGIIPADMVKDFRYVNGVALALIAMSAGGELRMKSLRQRLRGILAISGLQTLVTFSLVAGAVYLARGAVDFLEGEPARSALAVAILFGLVAVANSPATTIAVITEEKARGILTDAVLGITVLKDVVILILIAVLVPFSAALVDPSAGFSPQAVMEILLGIVGSIAIGGFLGWLMTLYLQRVKAYRILFVLGVAFLTVFIGEGLHLEFILIAMAAGFFAQNFSRQGRRLLHALEANALPIYAIFFAVAGANLDFTVLWTSWFIATCMILTRMGALWLSTYCGALITKDPPVIRRSAWMGFLAQAGVTLGIANLIRENFPLWGDSVATVIIAMIAVNQLVGPPAFRWILVRAGESHATPPGRGR